MVNLRIDNKDIEVDEGQTILDACEKLGIEIPTMCFMKGLKHFTSCMICVVRESSSGRLLPACSALAESGMVIETGCKEVIAARKDALDLLLSEHVGDCEAPCRQVCPAGINIPVMIRQIAAGDLKAAAATAADNTISISDPCADCGTRCEKPCRRRQHDAAVSIRKLVSFALSSGGTQGEKAAGPREKRFNCVIGKLREGEMAEFLKEAETYDRVEPDGKDFTEEEARKEARRCLHCDCRKAENCKLRSYADIYEASQQKYKATDRHPVRKDRDHPSVVYEPGKCIKCGLCVRITAETHEKLGLAFTARGYDSMIGVPFGESLGDALTSTAEECARACPTAALSFREKS